MSLGLTVANFIPRKRQKLTLGFSVTPLLFADTACGLSKVLTLARHTVNLSWARNDDPHAVNLLIPPL
ncbi:hypothetical protein JNB11_07655 [Kocuria palustris]|nr:hypothetical protein [Kocuria palustris]